MKYTFRRFGLALITVPIAAVAYGFIYFGLALVADTYASIGLFQSNLLGVAFGWVVAVTFSKQVFDFVGKVGNN